MSRRSASTGVLWQVLAPLARWPLTSPRRLLAVVGGLVAALLIVSVANAHTAGPAAPASSPVPVVAATTNPAPTGIPTVVNTGTPEDAAGRFAHAFLRPKMTQPGWSQALTLLATPDYQVQLATVDPRNIPASQVVGVAGAVVAGDTATVVVTTEHGTLTVALVKDRGSWLVRDVEPLALTPTGHAGTGLVPAYTPMPKGTP